MKAVVTRIAKCTADQLAVCHVTNVGSSATRSAPRLPRVQHVVTMTTGKRHTEQPKKHYPLVVIGGGTGGLSIAPEYCKKLGAGKVAVIEPADMHYYQAMWTMVGAGVKDILKSGKPMQSVLPKQCDWIKDSVVEFQPESNLIITERGQQIKYDFLVVCMGIGGDYHLIKGAEDALKHDKRVVSNFSRAYVEKTFPAIQAFQGGDLVFTLPNTPVKCAGAAQKIMYLSEHYFRKHGTRDKANFIFNTALGVMFTAPTYSKSLAKICKERDINVNFKRNLIEVNHEKSEAVFEILGSEKGEKETYKFDLLHIVPPMSAPDVLKASELTDDKGYMDLNKFTLQHVHYPNIFGIGDCTNLPTSKTGSAVAAQSAILKKHLDAVMAGNNVLEHKYDGYTSCPLLTQYGKCVMAEFDYDLRPLETFPFDQSKERTSLYYAKKNMMPLIYWNWAVNGLWEGPAKFRKLLHLGMSR